MAGKREVKSSSHSWNKGKKTKMEKDAQVRILHRCDTKYIVEVNNVLKATHRKRIEGTPFRWCLSLDKVLEINCPLIREVLNRWVVDGEFIRVGPHLVRLSIYDVCICLGLTMVGKSVPFDSEVSGLVGSLFENKPISVRDISKKIKNYVSSDDDDDVQSVCRLYLLLCFSVFYFPRTSRTVNNMPFKILDNLDNLSDFNWADSVHTFLIGGMNRGRKVLLENQNSSSLNIAGCVAVIQIWAARRLGLEDVQTENQFPRILHWPLVKIRTVNIKSLFEKTKVVFDWSLSDEDNNNPIVQTALSVLHEGTAKDDDNEFRGRSKAEVELEEKIQKHEMLIKEMKAELKKMRSEYLGRTAADTCDSEANVLNEDHCPPFEQKKSGPQDCVAEANVLNSIHGSPQQQEECNKAEVSPSPQKECDQSRIDMGKLYKDVTAHGSCSIVYAEVKGQLLRSNECHGFCPRGWIDNMSVLFAASYFMYKEKSETERVNRVIFSPLMRVIIDCNKRKINRRVWRVDDYRHYLPPDLCSIQEILRADLMQNVENLFWLLMNDKNQMKPTFELVIDDLPHQPNLHNCGILVLKYIQMWDGLKRFDGKNMPSYSCEELQHLRQYYICEWLLDPENLHRETVLQRFQPYLRN
ncbi:uncharacterized protein LOC114172019 [Vigna unguiculata]|uniref:uncharacterized protein LOC114172019 n=1 Tax=Vigna unguiculata TaxID=3917 RepID=UPI001015CB9A|nr:uncharacterized protein LOC114172019 [Vigna unguiculata]